MKKSEGNDEGREGRASLCSRRRLKLKGEKLGRVGRILHHNVDSKNQKSNFYCNSSVDQG